MKPGFGIKTGAAYLQGLVVLQNLLDATGNVVVLLPDDVGVHDTRGGIQRVHGGVDSQFGDGTRQYSGGVQVSKSGGWRGISQVISWHVNGLKQPVTKKSWPMAKHQPALK